MHLCGGEEEIRTLGTRLTYTRFPIVLLRPTRTPLRTSECLSMVNQPAWQVLFLEFYKILSQLLIII